jgi:hypothetical protein
VDSKDNVYVFNRGAHPVIVFEPGRRVLALLGRGHRFRQCSRDLIYDFRTMAERVNARLKDEFGARFLRVRGASHVRHRRARRRSDHPRRRLQDRPRLT